MEQSSAFKIMLERSFEKGCEVGRTEALREALIRLGTTKLGPMPLSLQEQLAAEEDAPQFEAMMQRLLVADRWGDVVLQGE